MSSSISALLLGCGLIGLSVQTVAGQQADSLRLGVRDTASDSAASTAAGSAPRGQPSTLRLTLASTAAGAAGAYLGGLAGFLIDGVYCKQHHGDETGFPFGPCAFYTAYGTAIGWFGGALLGATSRAAHIGRKRGCPRRTAIGRALGGAAAPAVFPGLLIITQRTREYRASRSVFVFTAPILAGAGAAAAVMGCHS
jgi:hypothetical protein